ncbi:MAG: M28 family peptidase [Bacteroidales bacterium]|jgi:hypothetical protein
MKKHIILFLLLLSIIAVSCKNKTKTSTTIPNSFSEDKLDIPEFSSDSSYNFVKEQTDFGPRVPGTDAHTQCAIYLTEKLSEYVDTVLVQDFKARVYSGKIFDGQNIIGVVNKEANKRILLCAHWDSRPYADHDPDPENLFTPIDGANDGASGVGVLLEIARLTKLKKPNVGLDIIFFDLEDYGPPESIQTFSDGEEWGLGAQYWAKQPHQYNYNAYYGILLDMVGGYNSKFYKEQFSVYYAKEIVDKIWDLAYKMGYSDYFINREGIYVTDDHLFVNKYANIPTINIIHQNPQSSENPFYEHWHTVNDNLENIDPQMLDVVGKVLTKAIYLE